jgi:hypothetical protein
MKNYLVGTAVSIALVVGACTPTETPQSQNNSAPSTPNQPQSSNNPTPSDTKQPQSPNNPTSSAPDQTSTWEEHTSDAGRYTALFPKKPSEQTQDLPTKLGTVKQFVTSSAIDEGAFFVAYNDFPDEVTQVDPQTILAESVKGVSKSLNGNIIEDRVTELSGFPCRSYVLDAKVSGIDANATGRICLVKNRLYQQLVLGEKTKITNTEIDRFIQSFKLAT